LTDYVGANFDLGETLGPEAVIVTCLSGEAITKGDFVKLSDATTFAVVAATAESVIFGVAMKATTGSGEYIPVCVFGRVKMECGATVTAGYPVKSDSAGLPLNATVSRAVDEGGSATYTIYLANVGGIALQSGVDGDYIVVFVGRR